MRKVRNRILAAVLCSAVVLSASQSVAWSEAADNAETEAVATESTDTAADSAEESEAAEEEVTSITEEQALAECKLYAENDQLALYVNESNGIFAVQVKSNGYCWWSNPYNADYDPVANNSKKEDLKSSLVINAVKVTDTEAPSTTIRSFKDCIKKNGLTVEKAENGVKLTYYFENEGITLPVYVELEGDHFNASIAVSEIVEKELLGEISESTRSVVDVNLFQDMGAAFSDEEGYIITPDGSGAVINFNNGKSNTSEYTQRIYGRDIAVSQDMAPKKTEQAYLPIMGMVKQDNALLAVVTDGSAYATARAAVTGQKATSYNSAWFNFKLRGSDSYYMSADTGSALNSYETNLVNNERMTVSYYPIAKNDVSYVDVALRYQQYLVEEMGLTKKTEAEQAPFYLDIFGGTVKQRSVLGFPVNLQTAATTYEQAKQIVTAFSDRGVRDMVITYNDFNKAGITSRISSSVDYASTLGGKSKYQELKSYCDGIGAILAPGVDLMEYERSGNGYSKTGASAIAVTKAYATLHDYERAFGTPHDTRAHWYILTPAYYTKVYGEIIASYQKEGMTAINVADGTNILYSDFTANTKKKTSRQDAQSILKECYQMINNSGMTFVSDAANDYALPYVDFLKDVPMYSSNFDVYDYDIPFYAIVIHGYIPYTTKAKNASSGADELFLLSVATGTPVHYEVMYEDPNEFTDCDYDKLFYSNYEGWLDVSAGEYKLISDHIKGLSDATITDFKYITENEVETTFSDGTVIYADLENLVLKVNGNEVDLANYGLKGANN